MATAPAVTGHNFQFSAVSLSGCFAKSGGKVFSFFRAVLGLCPDIFICEKVAEQKRCFLCKMGS